MPQLSIETYVTQYFWLIIFLATTYILSATLYLPKFAELVKIRKKLEFTSSLVVDSVSSSKSKRILSDILKTYNFSSSVAKLDNNFTSVIQNWVKHH